ncbi:MAG: hypothetical protein GX307_07545 [Euryarchaeota archaeon]|nr:hypothetical protein [Euryarchaeota archaeon]
MDEKELKSRAEKYAEQMGRMAAEAGKALDRAMSILETESKQMYEDISREAKPHTEEMKKLAKDVMGDVRNDIPRIRAELRDVETRAKEKLRELRDK